MHNTIAREQALRFVAGETRDEGLAAARELLDAGRWVSLDHVGEEVHELEAATAAADHYVEVLGRVRAAELDGRVGVSVKPTQLGLRVDAGACRDLVARVAAAAGRAHVTLDMEDHTVTDATLDLVDAMHAEGHAHVGVAVQVMLHRTPEDVDRMLELGASMRLCKGAYAEDEAIALQGRDEIRARYLELADRMLDRGVLPRFATHDHVLIEAIRGRLRLGDARPVDEVEFQMLHGVRVPLQDELVHAGLRTLVYLPYGREWYPYFVRRLAERPANLWFFLRALVG